VSGRAWLLVALGAVALIASYPPFPLPLLSFVAVVPAALLLQDSAGDPARAYRWGFRYGLAANGVVLHWIVVALWHFTPLAALGYVVTVFLLGVFTGGLFWFVTRVRIAYPALPVAVAFPVAWTALEWAVGHLGDVAFPWLGLGTSLADAPLLVQWADLAGARGVTLWLVWCTVLVCGVVGRWGQWGAIARRLLSVAVTVGLAAGYGVWRERTITLREVGTITLVQPNIAFHEKWLPERADSEVATLLALSRQATAVAKPQLVIWPEAALPYYLTLRPEWQSVIGRFASETRVAVLTGGLHFTAREGERTETFNAAFLFDSMGQWQPYPVYGKHYLVPVVERVPFVPVGWFRALPGLGRWSGGYARGRDLPVYATAVGRFGVIVCYESVFEDLPRSYRRDGADFLVNITNDAWYGRTVAPYQHASHLILRAIETRMGVARAANDGISNSSIPWAYISSRASARSRPWSGRLRTSDARSLYVRLGDWVGLLTLVATLSLAGALVLRQWRRSP
jgi:apolipoprotein N-acyltransferase